MPIDLHVRSVLEKYCSSFFLFINRCVFVLRSQQKRTREVSNGNRTEWSPIRPVNLRVITKSDDRAEGVRLNLFITSMITDRTGRHEDLLPINRKNNHFREKKNSQVMKEKEYLYSNSYKGAVNIPRPPCLLPPQSGTNNA